jgi:hypothetical protein
MLSRRLRGINARKDFLTTIVPKVHAGEMAKEELIANASTLMYENQFPISAQY